MALRQANRIVVIGGGHAAGDLAGRLRGLGYGGELTLLCEERYPPYQRPPLSKGYLLGATPLERVLLRPAELYAQEGVTLLLNERALWVDRAAKRVRLSAGRELAYDALVFATGAQARALPVPGAQKAGVHLLRTLDDVAGLRPVLQPGARLVVIGAGYVGLEAAASARTLGAEVTVLEAAPRPLSRVTSPAVAQHFLALHERHGVRFLFGAKAARFVGADRVSHVELEAGGMLACDAVLIGVGAAPRAELAEQCGLAVEDGVLTDEDCRTLDPAVFAIGDCARRPIPFAGGRSLRLESVHNAIEGAKIAAAAILGLPAPTLEPPWFWSDQYDAKLTIAGLFEGYDQMALRGDPGSADFAAFYYHKGRLTAVDAVNRPAEYLGAKQLLARGATIPPAVAEDVSRPFKSLMSEARSVAGPA
jgi:3-phenylpropionate/trans-cinnamate dioxygenase ferredoxin reductase subunit